MPLQVRTVTTGGDAYQHPMEGPVTHTAQLTIDISALSTTWVDSDGYLKPGTMIRENGLPISAASQYVFGIVLEPVRLGYYDGSFGNSAAILAGATDVQVAVATHGACLKAVLEGNIGRSLNDNELKAFKPTSGSFIKLLDFTLDT